MTGSWSSLAIIVVNYGASDLIADNLGALGRDTLAAGGRVVIVDNWSSTDERRRITALCRDAGWLLESRDGNDGFGVGMNVGVDRARTLGSTRFLLLNPDATIGSAAVSLLLAEVDADPLTMVAPRIERPDGSVWFAGSDLYLREGRIASRRRRRDDAGPIAEWLSGACLLVSAELWQRVGGFDDRYFLYWEDVDLSYRVVLAGGTVKVVDAAVSVHAEGGTQGSGATRGGTAKSTTYYFYNIRNRLLFAASHLDDAGRDRWLAATRAVSWEIIMQGGRRQFLTPWRPIGSYLRGVSAGRRIARAPRPRGQGPAGLR